MIVVGLIIVYINSYTSQALTINNDILTAVYFPVALIEYGGELGQLHLFVNEFLALRESPNGPDAKLKATQLDNEINNMEIVKRYCNEQISTYELALESNPYAKLQQICPILENLPFTKAADLFGKL